MIACPRLLYFALAALRSIPSMSGNGELIFFVLAFLARRSATTRNLGGLPGLGIHIIGAVLLPEAIFHLPVLMYDSLFWFHRLSNASGHRDGLHGYINPSSNSGIS
ncbi:hypothetical protein C0991_001042 [Blastosporella zonata]|nr:hypothetical protein C0991_001042 [Blastosporella zonata]